MAAAIVGTSATGYDGASNTTCATAAKSTTSGNSLLVGFLSQEGVGTANISSCADTAGNTFTALTEIDGEGGGALARWFYCHNITGNASNVCTGTWSAATRYKHAIQIEISGLANQTPLDQQGAIPTSATVASVSIAMGSAVGPIFAIATSTNDRTWTPGASFTEIADWGTSAAAEYYTGLNATGTVTTDITASGASNLTFSAVGFEEAPVNPVITAQPADQNVNAGATANFSVTATNATSYQWKKNGSNVGTNSSSYSLTAAYADQGAQITVDCINGTGTTTSSAATLRVAFNLTGTGPRAFTNLGAPFASGPVDAYLIGSAAAGGTHATTGALAADAATLAGTAAHSALHATTGALASQDATIAGTAAHLALHTSTGALSAQAATIAGTAAHQHAATGALSAQAAAIAGTAVHNLLHTSTGALTAQDATISGAAAHQHASTGALTAQDATIAGTAAHATLHTTTGALTAQDAAIAGTAAHEHATTGALAAQDATIAGSADHTTAGASHSTSGALTAQDATVAGAATHLTLHTSTGALTAQDATVAGTAAHQHAATGALAADAATIAGTAAHLTLHTSTGALAADAATISGAAAHEHATTGALAADAATIAGTAEHSAAGTHDATGDLAAQDATMSGVAEHIGTGESVLSPKFLGSPNVVIRGVKVEDKATDATPLSAQITNVPDAPPPVKLSPSIMDLLGFAPPVTPLPIETPEIPEFKVTVKPRKEPPAPDPAPEAAPLPPPPPPPPPVPRAEVDQMQVEAAAREKALSAQIASLEAEAAEVENALVRARARLAKVKQALTQRKQTVAQRKMNRQRAEEITRRLLKDLAEED